MPGLLTIDGSFGEGGGQIVRSSLALALVTGRPCMIENLRAGRKKPGLMRQHLTAVQAAAQIGQASVEGAEIGSRRLVFRPRSITPGEYHFDIGTAGSTTLVLQTILPALALAGGESRVTLSGGTHNPLAPPFDFLAKTYLPLLARMGPEVTATLARPGFYPAGGGRVEVHVRPVRSLGPLELLQRPEPVRPRVRAIVANLPRHIAERECRAIAQRTDWPESCFEVQEVRDSPGPGNVLLIEMESLEVTEVTSGFGQRGKRAEDVAADALAEAQRYLDAGVPVGQHLADQLLLPLGLGAASGTGGGAFRTLQPTAHTQTHLEVLRAFLDLRADLAQQGDDDWQVQLRPRTR